MRRMVTAALTLLIAAAAALSAPAVSQAAPANAGSPIDSTAPGADEFAALPAAASSERGAALATGMHRALLGSINAAEYRASGLNASPFLVDYSTAGAYLQYQKRALAGDSGSHLVDAWGVPQADYHGTRYYNPTTVAQYALSQYSILASALRTPETRYSPADGAPASLETADEDLVPVPHRADQPSDESATAARAAFQRSIIRLQMLQSPDGAFRYRFPWTYYLSGETYQPGWISGMAQGQAISALVRAYRYDPDPRSLDAARRAYQFLQVPIDEGGPRSNLSGISRSLADYVFYEEYISTPGGYTLNGYMFTMLGIWDWCRLTAELDLPDASGCAADFDGALRTLDRILPFYDLGTFTAYDLGHLTWRRPAPHIAARYHMVHMYLLHALGSVTGDETLAHYEQKFASYVA